ncbi:MAG: replicative DNA helicase [Planctomycetaceae bacterium]|nr:replicative DNA helicase [Planctomycetaceae bacterium]
MEPVADLDVLENSENDAPAGDWRGGGPTPHNLQAEQALLGGLLLQPNQFDFIEGKVNPEDFFAPTHGMVFAAMQALRARQQPIDPILLQTELMARGHLDTVGGVVGLAALTDAATTGANVEYYADIIQDLSARRRLIQTCTDTIIAASQPDATSTDLLGEAETSIRNIVTRNFGSKVFTMREVMQTTWDNIDAFMANSELVNGVTTSYTELDQMLTGLHDDELIIIAGRPAMGKSTFALNIARNVGVKSRQAVVVFTLEMSATNIVSNMLAAQAHVDGIKMRNHNFSREDMDRLNTATEQLNDAPIFIDETPAISLAELRGKARHLKLRNDIRLVVIDYLQLMTASAVARNRSREQEVSEVSRGLKALAKELHIPIIALSQLSRKPENRTDPRPMLSDLRESGAIEQDADVVLMLHRPDYYNKEGDVPTGEAEVIIAKQRNGPTGAVKLAFINHQLRFENLALRADYNPSEHM